MVTKSMAHPRWDQNRMTEKSVQAPGAQVFFRGSWNCIPWLTLSFSKANAYLILERIVFGRIRDLQVDIQVIMKQAGELLMNTKWARRWNH